jgi:hypothetical protein
MSLTLLRVLLTNHHHGVYFTRALTRSVTLHHPPSPSQVPAMSHRFTRLAAVAALAAMLPAAVSAQTTFFTTQASWTTALNGGGSGLDTFNDLLGASTPGPLNRSAGTFTYRATATGTDGLFFPAGTAADRWLSTNLAASPILFNNFLAGTNAIGGAIFGSDVSGAFLNGTINVAWVTSIGSGSINLVNAASNSFWGLVTTGTLTSLTITGSGVAPIIWPTMNDLRLGRALPATVVPEPSTYALMATGLVALALIRRRRA